MIDFAAVALSIAASAWLVAFGWRKWRGRPPSVASAALRVAVAVLIAAAVVLPAAWRLSSSRTFQPFGTLVRRVDTEQRLVALTFDDGPTPRVIPTLLDLLAERQVRATFFVTGAELDEAPELGKAIVAGGHELGNHTFSHRRMLGFSQSRIRDEIEPTDELIRATGHEGPIHFRAPYGKKLLALPLYLDRTDRMHVFWDVEPDSYTEVAASADRIVTHVLERVRPGSIILLHVMYPSRIESLKAVPGIIDGLREDGYRFVTVSELLAAE